MSDSRFWHEQIEATRESYEELILDLLDQLHGEGFIPYECLLETGLLEEDAKRLSDKYWNERVIEIIGEEEE